MLQPPKSRFRDLGMGPYRHDFKEGAFSYRIGVADWSGPSSAFIMSGGAPEWSDSTPHTVCLFCMACKSPPLLQNYAEGLISTNEAEWGGMQGDLFIVLVGGRWPCSNQGEIRSNNRNMETDARSNGTNLDINISIPSSLVGILS
jgi:hypothetical protein